MSTSGKGSWKYKAPIGPKKPSGKPKAASWDKSYRSLSRNSGGINAPNTFTEGNKPKKRAPDVKGIIGGFGAVAFNTDRKRGFSSTPPKKAAEAPAAKKATTPAAAPKKPASKAPKPAQQPSMKKGPASGEMAYKAPKFSGNWQGAAPTDMQKRGGAKISRGGGLLGKLRKK